MILRYPRTAIGQLASPSNELRVVVVLGHVVRFWQFRRRSEGQSDRSRAKPRTTGRSNNESHLSNGWACVLACWRCLRLVCGDSARELQERKLHHCKVLQQLIKLSARTALWARYETTFDRRKVRKRERSSIVISSASHAEDSLSLYVGTMSGLKAAERGIDVSMRRPRRFHMARSLAKRVAIHNAATNRECCQIFMLRFEEGSRPHSRSRIETRLLSIFKARNLWRYSAKPRSIGKRRRLANDWTMPGWRSVVQ